MIFSALLKPLTCLNQLPDFYAGRVFRFEVRVCLPSHITRGSISDYLLIDR